RRLLPPAAALPRGRDAEPRRDGGHLPPPRGAARPLHGAPHGRVPLARRRARDARATGGLRPPRPAERRDRRRAHREDDRRRPQALRLPRDQALCDRPRGGDPRGPGPAPGRLPARRDPAAARREGACRGERSRVRPARRRPGPRRSRARPPRAAEHRVAPHGSHALRHRRGHRPADRRPLSRSPPPGRRLTAVRPTLRGVAVGAVGLVLVLVAIAIGSTGLPRLGLVPVVAAVGALLFAWLTDPTREPHSLTVERVARPNPVS